MKIIWIIHKEKEKLIRRYNNASKLHKENFQYLQARRRRISSIYVEGFLISSNKPRIKYLFLIFLIG